MNKPELLAPAGDMEKLKIALAFGADAIYLGGRQYGLRAGSKNFDMTELSDAISYAHRNNAKAYVTVNIFAHNADLGGLPEYIAAISEAEADAVIVSDPGVFAIARQAAPNLEIHISTQANTTNYAAVRFWRDLDAKRVILARELSLNEISEIRQEIGSDFCLEAFVHGAMCMSYSGRCMLSKVMTGRDANAGSCAHPCRYKYTVMEETRPGTFYPVEMDERGTYIFNSKDLCMVGHIPQLVESGINSFKIEGRMKTALYVGTTVNAYRRAIDDFFTDPEKYATNIPMYMDELSKVSHRAYSTGMFIQDEDKNNREANIDTMHGGYHKDYEFIGIVRAYDTETGIATLEQRGKFSVGDTIEFLRTGTDEPASFTMNVEGMYDTHMMSISSAPHAQMVVKLHVPYPVNISDLVRRPLI